MKNLEQIRRELEKQKSLQTSLQQTLNKPSRGDTLEHVNLCEALKECEGRIKSLQWVIQ